MTAERSMIPYGKHCLDADDVQAVLETLRSDWLTQGPMVEQFETALASYCGARQAVVVSSGSMALHLACLVTGLGPGDEGITSPNSFISSATCILHHGARPVFADIHERSWNINPARIEEQITPRTKVLIPVHFGGLVCDMKEIRRIADQNRILVVEDASHALGAEYQGQRLGGAPWADMTCFSFHPVKNMTTGEGGAILTDEDELASRLRRLRHHGIAKNPERQNLNEGSWYYEATELGMNARISDIHCALGLSQLGKLDEFVGKRRKIAARYHQELAEIEGLTFQEVPEKCAHAYHLFVVHLDCDVHDRRQVFEALRAAGIVTQVHYIPLYRQPAIRALAGEQGPLPSMERYYEGCLSLPMFPTLSEPDQTRVIDALKRATNKGHS